MRGSRTLATRLCAFFDERGRYASVCGFARHNAISLPVVLTYRIEARGSEVSYADSSWRAINDAQTLADAVGERAYVFECSDEPYEKCTFVALPCGNWFDRVLASPFTLVVVATAAFVIANGWAGRYMLDSGFGPFLFIAAGTVSAGYLIKGVLELRSPHRVIWQANLAPSARWAATVLAILSGVAFFTFLTAHKAHTESCWAFRSGPQSSVWECAPGSAMDPGTVEDPGACDYQSETSSGGSIYVCSYSVSRNELRQPPV